MGARLQLRAGVPAVPAISAAGRSSLGFISSAAVLSLAFGPVSLAAMRHQLPDAGAAVPAARRDGAVGDLVRARRLRRLLVGLGHQLEGVRPRARGRAAAELPALAARRFLQASMRAESAWFGIFVSGLAAISYPATTATASSCWGTAATWPSSRSCRSASFAWRPGRGCPLPRPGAHRRARRRNSISNENAAG